MSEITGDFFPRMFGKRWFLFFLIGFFILSVYGVWIFSTPTYEIMFNHSTLPVVQAEESSLYCHIIEIGNTGRKIQDSVDIMFFTEAYNATAMTPKARDFGKVDRKTRINTSEDTTVMRLEKLQPGKRVEIQLVFVYRAEQTPYDWENIYKGIKAARGKAIEGDPGWTTVGRMLFAVFG